MKTDSAQTVTKDQPPFLNCLMQASQNNLKRPTSFLVSDLEGPETCQKGGWSLSLFEYYQPCLLVLQVTMQCGLNQLATMNIISQQYRVHYGGKSSLAVLTDDPSFEQFFTIILVLHTTVVIAYFLVYNWQILSYPDRTIYCMYHTIGHSVHSLGSTNAVLIRLSLVTMNIISIKLLYSKADIPGMSHTQSSRVVLSLHWWSQL